MDIILERVLSLIPKKESGDFAHGAKKKFAQEIGLESGNVISDWINGRSSSYKNYVYKIASIYGVSVEWLKGEADDKKAPASEGERISELYGEDETELLRRYRAASDDTKNAVRAVLGLPPVSRQREKIG